QFASADVAYSMAGYLQTNRHVDHRALVRHQQKPAQALRIVELLIALIIDPGCNQASTKSVNHEIFGQALNPTTWYPPPNAYLTTQRTALPPLCVPTLSRPSHPVPRS